MMEIYESFGQDGQQMRYGDEPIYCAAPSPADPDDIIWLGSDDGLDKGAKLARRARCEEQGMRYLEGKPLRIFSASLRGPFDKASGWQNPWLSRPSTTNPDSHRTVIPQPAIVSAINETFRDDVGHETRDTHTALQPDDSMLCHLPSPQSNRAVQMFDDSLNYEQRTRIQAWAENVPSRTLVKDSFWAPEPELEDETSEVSRKRPAGKEWLRKKSPKRKRLSNSQGSLPVSTPTPLMTVRPSQRSISAPVKLAAKKRSAIAAQSANRSLEMTTPSSSPDKKESQPTRAEAPGASRNGTVPSEDDAPMNLDASSAATTMSAIEKFSGHDLHSLRSSSKTTGRDIQVQALERQGPRRSDSHETLSNDCDDRVEQAEEDEREADTTLQSFVDESFYYRARPAKQDFPKSSSLNSETVNCSSQPDENATLNSPNHEHALDFSKPKQDEAQASPEGEPENNGANPIVTGDIDFDDISREVAQPDDRVLDRPTDDSVSSGDNRGASQGIDDKPVQPNNNSTLLSQRGSDGCHADSPTAAEPAATEDIDPGHGPSTVPLTLAEVKRGHQDAVGERPAEQDPAVDEGSTLIGDLTEINQSIAVETDKTHTDYDALETLIALKSEPETDFALKVEAKRAIIDDETFENQTDASDHRIVVPLSQRDLGVTQVTESILLNSCPTTEKKSVTSTVKIEEVAEEQQEEQQEDTTRDAPMMLVEACEPQSPWVSDVQTNNALELQQVKTEPVEEETSMLLDPIHVVLLSSPPRSCHTPAVPPSQQSPWGQQEILPSTVNQQQPGLPLFPAACDASGVRLVPPTEQQSPLNVSEAFGSEALTSPPRMTRHSTPELELSIKSFAKFHTSPPQRPLLVLSRRVRSSGGQHRGILCSETPSISGSGNLRTRRSSRRVSFAPLPGEDDDGASPRQQIPRATSPPPSQTIEQGGEDMEASMSYHRHFDAMKRRRISDATTLTRARLARRRLLPSSSQQRPVSPAIGAMAAAFQEADAVMQQSITPQSPEPQAVLEPTGRDTIAAEPQSPWQDQSLEVDDVADVMGNLDEFLDPWDVNAEMERARTAEEAPRKSLLGAESEMDVLRSTSVWG